MRSMMSGCGGCVCPLVNAGREAEHEMLLSCARRRRLFEYQRALPLNEPAIDFTSLQAGEIAVRVG